MGGGGGGGSLPFFKNRKKCHDFGKKSPDCVHLWVKVKLSNQIVALRVSRRKNSKMFPWGAFFLVFSKKRLSKCPSFTKPLQPIFRHYSFCNLVLSPCYETLNGDSNSPFLLNLLYADDTLFRKDMCGKSNN